MKTSLKVIVVIWVLLSLAALIFHDKLPMFLTGLVYDLATENSSIELKKDRSSTGTSITGRHVGDRLYIPVRGTGYCARTDYMYADFAKAANHRELVHILNVSYKKFPMYEKEISDLPKLVWNVDDGRHSISEIAQGQSILMAPPFDTPRRRGINNFVNVHWKQHFVIAEILKSPLYLLTPAVDVITSPIQIFLEALGSFRIGP